MLELVFFILVAVGQERAIWEIGRTLAIRVVCSAGVVCVSCFGAPEGQRLVFRWSGGMCLGGVEVLLQKVALRL